MPGSVGGSQMEGAALFLPAASERSDTSSGLKSTRISIKYGGNVRRSSPGTGKSSSSGALLNNRSISPGGGGSTCQIPERSGFPSAALGGGAKRFGLPSLVRGIP